MRAIDRWRQLTREEKRLVFRAACSIAAAAVALRVHGLKRMLAAEYGDHAEHAADDAEEIKKLVVAVDRAGRHVPGSTCLTQSLALTRMLGKRGIRTQIRFGVKTDRGFHAHAWVELSGVPITNTGSQHAALTRSGARP